MVGTKGKSGRHRNACECAKCMAKRGVVTNDEKPTMEKIVDECV